MLPKGVPAKPGQNSRSKSLLLPDQADQTKENPTASSHSTEGPPTVTNHLLKSQGHHWELYYDVPKLHARQIALQRLLSNIGRQVLPKLMGNTTGYWRNN